MPSSTIDKRVSTQVSAHESESSAITSRILTIRGVQVMLDRDLAELYGVETKALNQAVKRNRERFPPEFMFALGKEEMAELVTNCDRFSSMKHASSPMKAFSEHGVIMLASVLRSATATQISVRITRAFVAMRRTLASMAPMLARIEATERRQLEDRTRQISDQRRNEERFDEIFEAMRDKRFPDQKVFYDGQVFDASAFAQKHILSARKSILLIDNWVDVTTLEMLAKTAKGVAVEIVTSKKGNRLAASDIAKFNAQHGGLTVRESKAFHDRFLIVDETSLYLFGASLKDLGAKCFAFTQLDAAEIPHLKARI